MRSTGAVVGIGVVIALVVLLCLGLLVLLKSTGAVASMGVVIVLAVVLCLGLLVLVVLAIVWLLRKLGVSQTKGS